MGCVCGGDGGGGGARVLSSPSHYDKEKIELECSKKPRFLLIKKRGFLSYSLYRATWILWHFSLPPTIGTVKKLFTTTYHLIFMLQNEVGLEEFFERAKQIMCIPLLYLLYMYYCCNS